MTLVLVEKRFTNIYDEKADFLMKHTGLSEDEIIRDWSLHAEDLAFVKKFRKQYQLWVYLQVCSLKLLGQLLENPNVLDTQIIGHACKSLLLNLVGTVEVPERDATRTDYKKSIFTHLKFKPFNNAKDKLYSWLEQKVKAGWFVPENLIPEAESFLIASKIALPTLYYLKRHINSFCSQQQEKIFANIYQQLHEPLINSIDELLEVIDGEDVTWFHKFKEYPGSSSISLLQDYLRRYHRVESIDLSGIDFSAVPPDLAQYLYQLAKHYDAYKIKRFKPPKRYSLMLLFLDESKKILMDYLIQLHDQYISNVCRELC